jgi:hypothetical protein
MSRFQAPPSQQAAENPNLRPRSAQLDPWASRGRFQQANLATDSAEDRTKLAPGLTWENRFNVPRSKQQQQTHVETTTSEEKVPSDVQHDEPHDQLKAGKGKVVEEETTTTIIE